MCTSSQFGGSILKGGKKDFRNECGHVVKTIAMFTQKRGDRGEHKYTSGSNLSQVDPVPGKYGQLYRHTECYACHNYGKFADQLPD